MAKGAGPSDCVGCQHCIPVGFTNKCPHAKEKFPCRHYARFRVGGDVAKDREVSKYMIECDGEAIAWFLHKSDRDTALDALREEHPDSEFLDSEEYG